ncbi:MAG: hypothetical protein ABI686_13445, partial [Acidobacteriota bacterium]
MTAKYKKSELAKYENPSKTRTRIDGSVKTWWQTTAVFSCASLFLMLFFLSGASVVKADYSIGNVPVGNAPQSVAVNPVTNK